MTVDCPEVLVVLLVADRLPDVALQLTFLFPNATPPEVSVAVRTCVLPEYRLKLDGEIDNDVETGVTGVSSPLW